MSSIGATSTAAAKAAVVAVEASEASDDDVLAYDGAQMQAEGFSRGTIGPWGFNGVL